MTQVLNDNRYFFQGIILNNSAITFSQLEGLKRRFPQAWLKREDYPFYRHACFKSISLQLEYRFNLCYCLVEYSRENIELFRELKGFFMNYNKKITQEMKNRQRGKKIVLNGVQNLILAYNNQKKFGMQECTEMVLADYLAESFSIPYPESFKEEYFEIFNEVSLDIIQSFGNGSILNFYTLPESIRKKKGKTYQFFQECYQRYSNYLNQPLSKYLNTQLKRLLDLSENEEENNDRGLVASMVLFGIIPPSCYRETCLSMSEIFEILAAVTLNYGIPTSVMEETTQRSRADNLVTWGVDENGDITEKAWKELFHVYDKDMIPYALEYLLAKAHNDNRDLFFKLTDTSDLISLKSLETEIKQQHESLKDERQKNKRLEKQLSTIQTQQQQKIKEATVKVQKELIETNQKLTKKTNEVEQLASELEQCKELIKLLQTQLSEQTPQSEEEVTLTLSDEKKSLLNQPSILFLGGHPTTIHRLKRVLPSCKFFEVDKTYDSQFLKNVKQVFIFVNYVNHGMVYQINKELSVPKRVLIGTNINQILKQCLDCLAI